MDGKACEKKPLPETWEANLIMSNKACGAETGQRWGGERTARASQDGGVALAKSNTQRD